MEKGVEKMDLSKVVDLKGKTQIVLEGLSDYGYYLKSVIDKVFKDSAELGSVKGEVEKAQKELEIINKQITFGRETREKEIKEHAEIRERKDRENKARDEASKADREEAQRILEEVKMTMAILRKEKEELSVQKVSFEAKRARIAEMVG